jgi:hypothetical protein
MEAGIPFTTCGVLTAIEKTPLYARLEKEGRLLPYDSALVQGHGASDLNFVPKLMSQEEMQRGYNWLVRSLYKYENYGARLVKALAQFHPQHRLSRGAANKIDWNMLCVAARVVRHFLLTADRTRRRVFLKTFWQVMRHQPSSDKLIEAVGYMIGHKHFHEYVTAVHGDPEAVSPLSPFAAAASIKEWWEEGFDKQRVKRLKKELFSAGRWAWVGQRLRHTAAIPEAFLKDTAGRCLRQYLNALGVEVVPVAMATLSRLRERADVFILPSLGKVMKGHEELQQVIWHLQERIQVDLPDLPKIIHFPLDKDHKEIFDAFARVGLLFTRRIGRLRVAYKKAVESALMPFA